MKKTILSVLVGTALSTSAISFSAHASEKEGNVGSDIKSNELKKDNLIAGGREVFSTCVGCHGVNAEGGVGPRLSGKSNLEIFQKLYKYKKGEILTPMSQIMTPIAKNLTHEQIKKVSFYIDQAFSKESYEKDEEILYDEEEAPDTPITASQNHENKGK